MGLRNTLLIGALIAGLMAIVILYVRRGFNDLQGQIDAIETMLASLPPELTSGDPLEYPHPTSHLPPLASGGSLQPAAVGDDGPDPDFAPDEEPEGVDANEYTDYGDYDATPHYADEPDIPEYTLSGGIESVATLSEPGVYETGVTQITVLPAGADQDMELEHSDDASEDERSEDDHASERGEDEGEEADGGADGVEDDGADGDGDEPVEDDAESLPPTPPGDEFNILTLPQLKARLKAVQPDMRGIARMKRAEVLDRLRSLPVEEGEE
jgi:hypothetical protein